MTWCAVTKFALQSWGSNWPVAGRGGGGIPRQWGCDRRATTPQANFNATRRAAVLFRAHFVARSLQIHFGICASLAPRLREKSLAAIVKPILFQHTSAAESQPKHPREENRPAKR